MSKKYIVYLIEIPNDPKPYIGITSEKSAKIRVRKGYPKNPPLQNAIDKAGGVDKIKITELEKELSKTEASAKEAYNCDLYNALVPNGYNKQPGGLYGYHLTQSTKDKISSANSQPVAQIDDKNNRIVAFFASQIEADRITKINNRHISEVVNGLRKHAGKYDWRQADHILTPDEIKLIFDPDSPEEITLQ